MYKSIAIVVAACSLPSLAHAQQPVAAPSTHCCQPAAPVDCCQPQIYPQPQEVPCGDCEGPCKPVAETKSFEYTVASDKTKYQAFAGNGGVYALNVLTGIVYKLDETSHKWSEISQSLPD